MNKRTEFPHTALVCRNWNLNGFIPVQKKIIQFYAFELIKNVYEYASSTTPFHIEVFH